MKLCYAVVGKPGAFVVDIQSNATVFELQDVITAKQQYTRFHASELTLSRVKQGDSWLSTDPTKRKRS